MKYLIFLCIVLSSCSANYHFRKFLSKGGKIDTLERVETIIDTLRINGKDSVIRLRVPVACPDPVVPPTRQEIRYKYKLQHDSIVTVRYVTKWKTKREIKEVKSEH